MTTKESLKSTLDGVREELTSLEARIEELYTRQNRLIAEQAQLEAQDDESNGLIADFMKACHAPKSEWRIIRSFSGVLPYDHLMKVVDEINNFTATNEDKHLYSVEITESHCIIRQDFSTAVLVQRPRGAKAKEIIYVAVAEFALRFAKYGLSL